MGENLFIRGGWIGHKQPRIGRVKPVCPLGSGARSSLDTLFVINIQRMNGRCCSVIDTLIRR